MYTPFGEHCFQRFGGGSDFNGTDLPDADDVGVKGKQFLYQAVHVMTVGKAVMNVEGRLRPSVAEDQSQMYQELALVEV